MTQPHLSPLSLRVNGVAVHAQVEPRQHLADFLREQLGLTGTHLGCEYGVCGACTVRVNGRIVRACLMLAIQAQDSEVQTIEGLDAQGNFQDLQQAFVQRNALQCGFCTPGMVMCASALLEQGGCPSRTEIRAHISGNYCRCTGYEAIVDAIEVTAQSRAGLSKA